MRGIGSRLTYANVIATLALFLALGGGAWALSRGEVQSKHIAKGAVKKSDLARGAVKKGKLDKDSVNTRKVIDGSLLGEDFAEGELPQGEPGPQGDQGEIGPPGPTEGTGVPGVATTTLQSLVDKDDFTTTSAGRLLVTKPITRVRVNCPTGTTWHGWLVVDGVAVPGSEMRFLPDETDLWGLVFTGVTSDLVAAGQHTARVAAACSEGTGPGTLVNESGGVSAVVLGA